MFSSFSATFYFVDFFNKHPQTDDKKIDQVTKMVVVEIVDVDLFSKF